jgi:hypothetical protein
LVIVRAIEHTGIPLEGWLKSPKRQHVAPAPRPAADGPLKGERVFILGEPRDGPTAKLVAGLASRVVSSVGPTTTIVAVIGPEPFGYDVRYNPQFRKAEEFIRAGQSVRILTQSEIGELLEPFEPILQPDDAYAQLPDGPAWRTTVRGRIGMPPMVFSGATGSGLAPKIDRARGAGSGLDVR